ncbi:hypothetical protein MTsPCn9_34080 [Croceitalea sp. MTPC9]|uniref:hypothetical protein n=1 Tax=unclassified Croceitalea TaxID=2632280 RepID=UPI002B3C8D07|nr:hypothetical protein MTsPCn6_34870 [Croceitalea sp. MTPC6]GMN18468.1 hypothetical protein MTsPCn9_34080 [Croceitalea sp. MTPC9]
MEDFVFEAIMSSEPFICNNCLVQESKQPIDAFYQDVGICEKCGQTNDVTKPIAAASLIKNRFDLYGNNKIRELFFRTRPVNMRKETLHGHLR